MLKAKKVESDNEGSPTPTQAQPSPSALNRISIPIEDGIRPVAGIKELIALAESSRGKEIELSWTTGKPGQTFVLDVFWPSSADDPSFTLYEQDEKESKTLWNQTFKAGDVELLYDVLLMSCGNVPKAAEGKLADIIKPLMTAERKTKGKGKRQTWS